MPLSLNNSIDIVANSISIIKGNKTIDLLTSLSDKADANTTISQTVLNTLLDAKVGHTEMANYFSTTVDTYTGDVSIYTSEIISEFLQVRQTLPVHGN